MIIKSLINFFLKKTNKIILKKNFNTFEFINLDTCCEKVLHKNVFFKKKNLYLSLYPSSFLKITKPDFFDNTNDLSKILNHPTIGISLKELIKGKFISGSYFANLNNALVIDNSILVMISENLALTESYGDQNWLNFRLNKWPEAHNFKSGIIFFSNKFFINKRIKIYELKKKVKLIKKKVIYLSAIREDNFFHWIFDTVPRLKCIELSSKLKKLPIIVRSPLNNYQKDMLKLFGIKNKVLVTNKSSYIASNLFFPTTSSPPILNIPTVKWLRNKFLNVINKDNKKFSNNQRIYVSREDTDHRKLKNSAEIEIMLQKYGFKKYILSKYKIKQQIEIFSKASFIIMPHGAAGSHLLSVKKNSIFIELHSPNQLNNMFCCLCKILSIKYGFIIGTKADQNNNFNIDVKKLEFMIQKILKKIHNI